MQPHGPGRCGGGGSDATPKHQQDQLRPSRKGQGSSGPAGCVLDAAPTRKATTTSAACCPDGVPSACRGHHSPGSSIQHSAPETSPDTISSSGMVTMAHKLDTGLRTLLTLRSAQPQDSASSRPCGSGGASAPATCQPPPAALAAPTSTVDVSTSAQESAACFLQTLCASEASVLALAVLAHTNQLPVAGPGAACEELSSALLPDDGYSGALVMTLAYCSELAVRGGLTGALEDTCFRMLLWTVEAFHSQYRVCVKQAVVDYCFYGSGCRSDDPLVVDTLNDEVPDMVALQLQLLKASGWRLWVQEPELHAAAAALASGGALLRTVLHAVQQQVRAFEALRRMFAAQRSPQGPQPLAAAAAVSVSSSGLVSLQQPSGLSTVAVAAGSAAASDQGPPVCEVQDADALVVVHVAPRQQAAALSAAAAAAARPGSSSSLRAAKEQLLQLASREQSVGRKRRHGSMAGGLPPLQPGGRQAQDGAVGGPPAPAKAAADVAMADAAMADAAVTSLWAVVAGGKRLVKRAVRAAQAATQHLGCFTQ